MRITDIAPTLLALHEEPIPEAMDGTVRTELFAEGTEMSQRELQCDDIRWVEAEREEAGRTGDAVHSRLANLGYVDE
jgi:hypothetical protein